VRGNFHAQLGGAREQSRPATRLHDSESGIFSERLRELPLSTGVFAAKAIRHAIALIRTLLIESVAADVLLPEAPAEAEDESDCRKDDRYPIGLSDR
jgi:hypothetical protein